MANYYLDFVGLNTFIYEASRWDDDEEAHLVKKLTGSLNQYLSKS